MRAIQLRELGAPLVEAKVTPNLVGTRDVRIRIDACGICHSDAHYRAGFGAIATPRTLGHEIAGTVTELGDSVTEIALGDRVAVHYLRSCGTCRSCVAAGEQFCEAGAMIGKHCDGGYAEEIVIPAVNAIPIPSNVPTEIAAVMMCSTATAYHALRVGGFKPGVSIAILGLGGLGISALQLCRAFGARKIAAVDVVPDKLREATALGATAVDANSTSISDALRDMTEGYGMDITVDFTGLPKVASSALAGLAPRGRLVFVALSEARFSVNPYRDLLGKERAIVGCSDHLRSELFELMELASSGQLDLSNAISRRVSLDERAVNDALDDLERGTSALRTVIVPTRLAQST